MVREMLIAVSENPAARAQRVHLSDPPDRPTQTDKSASQENVEGTLDLEDFGAEVRLSFDQRVPWSVALEILRLLKVEEVERRKRDRRDE
jgi:hypothetical protein